MQCSWKEKSRFHCRTINLPAVSHRGRAQPSLHNDIRVNDVLYISDRSKEQSIVGNPLREDFLLAWRQCGRCGLSLALSFDPPFQLSGPQGHNL